MWRGRLGGCFYVGCYEGLEDWSYKARRCTCIIWIEWSSMAGVDTLLWGGKHARSQCTMYCMYEIDGQSSIIISMSKLYQHSNLQTSQDILNDLSSSSSSS